MFLPLVQDNRRKGRSAGPLVESSITLPKLAIAKDKSTRLQEKANKKLEEEEFNESLSKEAMTLAIDAVRSGRSTIYKAANEFGLYESTLTRHVKAASSQGTSLPDISRGRKCYLSEKTIEIEKQKARDNDDRLKSRYSDQWLEYFHEVQKQNYIGGPKISPLKLMSAKSAKMYRDLIAPDQVNTYDQNKSRAIALEDIYSHLAWVIVLRIWHGYTDDTSSLGREEGQESINRKIENAVNIDESSSYLADPKARKVSMSAGAMEALKEKHQSARGQKSSEALPVQRRVARYAPVATNTKLLAFIHYITDHEFVKGSIDIFRCPRNKLHWLVRRGDGSCGYTCALRVLTEIVGTVFDEYKTSLKELEDVPVVPTALIQPGHFAMYNGPTKLGIGSNEVGAIMADPEYHENEVEIEQSNDLENSIQSIALINDRVNDNDEVGNKDIVEEPEDNDISNAPIVNSIIDELRKMTKSEITLFMDGETHYLRQVMRIVLDNKTNHNVIKSGGSSSGFQQLLDSIRGFMALRKRLTGASFWKLLELNDNDLPKNELTAAFGPLLRDMDASSRRTYMAYFSMIEGEVQKIWTPAMLSQGVKMIGIDDFNQEFILNKCPGYETHFTAEDKAEIYRRLPALIKECIPHSCAPDDLIYTHLGDIVGPPSRGLPTTSFRKDNQWDSQDDPQMNLLMEPALNTPDRPVSKNAIPVSALDFGRHRAYLLTSDSIKAGLAVQADYKAGLIRAKKEKEQNRKLAQEQKLAAKIITSEKKAKSKTESAELKALGPKRKIYVPRGSVKECHQCLVNYPSEPMNAIRWVSCDYCGRLSCSEAICAEIMTRHIDACKQKQRRTALERQAAELNTFSSKL